MLPIGFPQENMLLGLPEDLIHEEHSILPACQAVHRDGLPLVITCWKLSKEDLETITRTGKVWLSVVGTDMPAVQLDAESPFSADDVTVQVEGSGDDTKG